MGDVLVGEARVGGGDGAEVEDRLNVWGSLLAGSEVVEVVDENGLDAIRRGSRNFVILGYDLLWGL